MDNYDSSQSRSLFHGRPPGPAVEPCEDPFSTQNAVASEPLIRRKPLLPPRSSRKSLDQRSYSLIEMQQMGRNETLLVQDEDTLRKFPRPKAFHKTHLFFGLNLGYWRQPARHFSVFIMLLSSTIVPLYLVSSHFGSISSSDSAPFQYDCHGQLNGWSFIGINLRFGQFSYGAAKALDLAWNWIVGRGLQGIFTLVAYRVFNDALLRAAEMTPLSYELYASLSLYSTKPDILWQLFKGVGRRGNWRTKFIFFWLFISTVYLVVFPSLLDACSGYEVSYTASFQWPNGTLQDVDSLVGWETDTAIVNTTEVCATWYRYGNGTAYNYTYHFWSPDTDTAIIYNSTQVGPNGTSQSWTYKHCGRSTGDGAINELNSLFYWTDLTLNESWWKHFLDDPWTSQSSDGAWATWHFYPTDSRNYRCNTARDLTTYQWGFSYGWLFVAAIVNSAWLLGLWILWLDCDTNSELCKKGRRLGLWRAVADISEALREELGPNICAYSEEELADALEKRPPIKYYVINGTGNEPGHIGLSSTPRTTSRFRLSWNQEYGKDR